MKLAGHEFAPFQDTCSCGKKLLDLMSVTKADIGKEGISHYGAMNEIEYQSIEDYRNRCAGITDLKAS